jgi:5-methylthioadenosine/S-adenosylhomocysteine deaminase
MLLVRNADYILTLDDRRRILRGHSLFIDGATIADIGPARLMDEKYRERCQAADSVIEAAGCLVMPGYVNTHVHTFEHLSRGLIPDDLSTNAWAATYARPFYAGLTEDEAYTGARLACLDMLKNGTTCFIDANILLSTAHLDAVVQAIDELGLRAIVGRGLFDIMPDAMAANIPAATRARIVAPSPEAALAEAEALLRRWRARSGDRIRTWATIYGLFTYCSDALFVGIRRLADRYGVGAACHMASSIEEARAVEARTGAWPITQLDRLGVLGPNLLLTHCTAVTDGEVDLLAARGTKVAFCPGAALRLAKGTTRIGKIPEMLARGVTVSIGADGVSSSGSFDQLRLAGLVAGLFKDARMDPTLVPAEQALEMVTLEGAKAALWDDAIGSIAVGKRADLVQYDIGGPEWVPVHDVVRNLIYCADGRSVRHVVVDGRVALRDRALVGVDETAILDQAREAGARIAHRLGLDPRTRWPVVTAE